MITSNPNPEEYRRKLMELWTSAGMSKEEAEWKYIHDHCIVTTPITDDYVMTTHYEPMRLKWVRAKEAMWLLEHKLYYAAATLIFTFPEICGRVECNNFVLQDGPKIYRDWYDANITKFFPNDYFTDIPSAICMNGYLAYKLRCQLVHGIQQELTDIPNGESSNWMKHYKRVNFKLTNQEYSIRRDIHANKTVTIFVGLPQIARQLIRVADSVYTKYYPKYPEKFKTALDTWG